MRTVIKMVYVVLITALAFLPSAANGYIASFDGDTNAEITGTTGLFSTSVTFGSTVYDFKGYVDYAVYAPGNYSGNLPIGTEDGYVYAYQIFNSSESDVSVGQFTIGLGPTIVADNTSSDDSIGLTTGGIDADVSNIAAQSAVYLFFAQGITAGNHSNALIFTSPNSYDMGGAYIAGGITGGTFVSLPTPTVPEPVTAVLFASGACLVLRKKNKKA